MREHLVSGPDRQRCSIPAFQQKDGTLKLQVANIFCRYDAQLRVDVAVLLTIRQRLQGFVVLIRMFQFSDAARSRELAGVSCCEMLVVRLWCAEA